MNNAGEIAGYYTDNANKQHGFIRTADGTVTAFDAPGAANSFVLGIGPDGTACGFENDASTVATGIVRAPDGTITTISALGAGTVTGTGTYAYAVNARDWVAGYMVDNAGVVHGFLSK